MTKYLKASFRTFQIVHIYLHPTFSSSNNLMEVSLNDGPTRFCLRFIILGDLIAISKTKTCRKLFFTKVVLCSRAVWVVWEQALGSQWGRQVAQLGAERSLPPKIESPISIHSLLALAMKAGSPLCCHSLLIHNCGLVPAATDRTQPVVRERVVCGDWAPSLVSVPTPLPVESGTGN